MCNLRRHRKVHKNSAQQSESTPPSELETPLNAEGSPEPPVLKPGLTTPHIPPYVQDVLNKQPNEPMATDSFGHSALKRIEILEKEIEGMQKLRAQATEGRRSKTSRLLEAEKSTFQCTFCHVKLSEKAWRRHEESQHMPRRQWTCMPLGHPFDALFLDGASHCLLCGACFESGPDSGPTKFGHIKVCPNRVADCLARSPEERTFHRKDHLVQHLKRFHQAALTRDRIDLWESENKQINRQWNCGFCGEILPNWNARATHIAAHFRQGLDMSVWDSTRSTFDDIGQNIHSPPIDFGTDDFLDDFSDAFCVQDSI